jgi:hypothetical protein
MRKPPVWAFPLVMVGLLATVLIVRVLCEASNRRVRIRAYVWTLSHALHMYEAENGIMPPTLEYLDKTAVEFDAGELFRTTIYTYWESDGYDFPVPLDYPGERRLWFYHPIEKDRAWFCIDGGPIELEGVLRRKEVEERK